MSDTETLVLSVALKKNDIQKCKSYLTFYNQSHDDSSFPWSNKGHKTQEQYTINPNVQIPKNRCVYCIRLYKLKLAIVVILTNPKHPLVSVGFKRTWY